MIIEEQKIRYIKEHTENSKDKDIISSEQENEDEYLDLNNVTLVE